MSKLIKNNNKIIYSSYRQIPNSASAWTVTAGSLTTVNENQPDGYIQANVTPTIAHLESTQAYGEWYFDVYAAAGNNIYFYFISDATTIPPTNYVRLWVRYSTGAIYIQSNAGTILSTAVEYITTNTWNSIKITRSGSTYNMYIKGGSYGNLWTFSGTGTSAINTTNTYMTLSYGTNSRIRNVRFKPSTGYNTVIK